MELIMILLTTLTGGLGEQSGASSTFRGHQGDCMIWLATRGWR